ncbi:MAG: heme lyase CcmF/NrfE family subunit [Candidatus Latescibacterota bacterium]|nr:MAG: heme lyase CcmF/NrfE family subunit [Candidatus Latescibacterota bacterium]
MANFGNLSLLLAFSVTVYAILALFLGWRTQRRELAKSGEYAVYASCFFVTLSAIALFHLFATSNFNVEYVARYSNRDLPMSYKLAAFWGGQQGSLLFWTWVLTIFAAIVTFQSRRRRSDLVTVALGIISITTLFFLLLNNFLENPFGRLGILHEGNQQPMPFAPSDGRGLNPLLQHPIMVIHPPVLFLGYVGFVVPAAFALAALVTRELGNAWVTLIRRWALLAWGFLGIGIILGARWAYVELGWGGYWAWDPVENASFMPWLTGTAFLHSAIIQEKKNMLKVWNVVLIIATYLLCIFGTFLTRSGIVSSVHAFAESEVGVYFIAFIALTGVASIILIFVRLDYLKSESSFDSIVSREASFMFNNLVFLGACFAVFWGTMYPVFSEAIQGEKITIGPPFFNKIYVPLGLFILFLTGVAPLLAWRKTSFKSLNKNFFWPLALSIVAAIVLFFAGVRQIAPLVAFFLAIFVTLTILIEFFRGVGARMRAHGESVANALFNLVAKNKRRYGGYIVHFGIVLLFIGFSGAAFNQEAQGELGEGDSITIGDYTLVCEKLEEKDTPNYYLVEAALAVSKNGKPVTMLYPQKRVYKASEQSTSEVAMRSTLREDLYTVFAGLSQESGKAVIQLYINPLVSWLWLGGTIMGLGTIICILPDAGTTRSVRGRKALDRLLTSDEKM